MKDCDRTRATAASALRTRSSATPFAVLGIRTAAAPYRHRVPAAVRARRRADRCAGRARVPASSSATSPIGEFRFELPLAPAGTRVPAPGLGCALAIPVGESRTYGELARRLHTAPRAVGGACGANPIALVIPCHRVVGTHGSLGGFMGVTDGDPIAIKRWLLTHEAIASAVARAAALRSRYRCMPEPVHANDAATLIDAFCDQVWLQDGLAASSLASYRRDLMQWAEWLAAQRAQDPARRGAWRRRGFSRSAIPGQGQGDFDRSSAVVAAPLLSPARTAEARSRPIRRCACARPSCRAGCRRVFPKQQVEALLAAPGHRHAARPARSRDARDALRHRLARLRARRASSSRRSASTWAWCVSSARAARSDWCRSARKRSMWLKRYLAYGADRARRRRQERRGVRHRPPQAAVATGILAAHQALCRQGRRSRRRTCRRTPCGMRSRPTCSITARICASCSSCSGIPTSRRRRSIRTSRASG